MGRIATALRRLVRFDLRTPAADAPAPAPLDTGHGDADEDWPPAASTQIRNQYITDVSTRLRYLRTWIDDPDAALELDPEVYEKLEKEVVIAGARKYRRVKVAGAEKAVQIVPGDDDSAPLVPIFKRLTAGIERFTTARYNLADSFFKGLTCAQIEGEWRDAVMPGDSESRRWWFPVALRDVDKRRLLQEYDQDRNERWTIWDFRRNERVQITPDIAWHYVWYRYDTQERSLNYGQGMAAMLVYYWTVKTIAFETFVRGAERWGYGWIVAGLSGLLGGATATNLSTYQAKVDTLIGQLEKQREKHIFVCDKDAVEVNVVEPSAQGSQMLLNILNYCDTQIRVLMLASVLPTGGGQEVGSFARSETEENSAEAEFLYDRSALAESLTIGVLGAVRRCNQQNLDAIGLGGMATPKYLLQNPDPVDHKERVEKFKTLHEMGVPLSFSEVYEQTGTTPPDPMAPEDELKGGAPQAQPGMPGANPFDPTQQGHPQPAGAEAQPQPPALMRALTDLRAEVAKEAQAEEVEEVREVESLRAELRELKAYMVGAASNRQASGLTVQAQTVQFGAQEGPAQITIAKGAFEALNLPQTVVNNNVAPTPVVVKAENMFAPTFAPTFAPEQTIEPAEVKVLPPPVAPVEPRVKRVEIEVGGKTYTGKVEG